MKEITMWLVSAVLVSGIIFYMCYFVSMHPVVVTCPENVYYGHSSSVYDYNMKTGVTDVLGSSSNTMRAAWYPDCVVDWEGYR